jgi:hypothetical protein
LTSPPFDPGTSPGPHHLAFEVYGVRVGVSTNDVRVWAHLPELAPPQSRPCDVTTVEHHFSVLTEDKGVTFTVLYDVRDGEPANPAEVATYVASDVDLDLALGLVDTHVTGAIGLRAPDHVFIHAGAVAHDGRMIVMPSAPLTGKTTLVGALVRAGGTYYSDRFAVIDSEGRVCPYTTPLRLYGDYGAGPTDNGASSGPPTGEEPLPVGAVVLTSYRPGAEWQPRQLSRGESLVKLISQTIPAQDRPDYSVRILRRLLAAEPLVIESDRDEAATLAPKLLDELSRQLSAS